MHLPRADFVKLIEICFLDSACFDDDIEDKEEGGGGAKGAGEGGRGVEQLY